MLPQLAPPAPPPSSHNLTPGSFGPILFHKTSPPSITKQISLLQNLNSRTSTPLSPSFLNEVLISNLLNPFLPHLHTSGLTLQNTFHPYTLSTLLPHLPSLPTSSLLTSLILPLTTSLTSALLHLHTLPLHHNDLKPSNILLTRNLQPLLIDYTLSSPSSTTKGGTKQYRPPECFTGGTSESADVYGLGCIVVEMFNRGYRVVDGTTEIEVMGKLEWLDLGGRAGGGERVWGGMWRRGEREFWKGEGGEFREEVWEWWREVMEKEEKGKGKKVEEEGWEDRFDVLEGLEITCEG
ncbi:hypothetical protein TrST_g13248 [Triparma strigata]|uniref:Cyclin-dependent kinase 2 homolog n=1 Tax=Triparma strigata TaxID=1606541 RepID=A0A9W7E8K6_9STRA|nr:hypothetical protein TrST_g13248 [Triparma strigata]